MGLIRVIKGAVEGSVKGVVADQWREYFYCEALPVNVLAAKGKKRTSERSMNTQGTDNIISNGSIITVADGQCMLIVDQGKVVDICAEPGDFTYNASTEPSLFYGDLGDNIKNVFMNIGKRFTFGAEAPKDQRIYYFNTKEIIGNKYGTPSPVPFRVVDERAGIDIDIAIKCFGEYSYKLVNPLLFYTNVCGNFADEYTRDQLDSQLKSELLTALQPAFAQVSSMGIRYSALPGHTLELANALKEILSSQWSEFRGIEIQQIGLSSVKASEEDEQMIKELQKDAAFMDPTRAAAHLVSAQASAMKSAAANENAGPAMAFMGLNMANQAGGVNAQNLFAMGQQQPNTPMSENHTTATSPEYVAPANKSWKCNCGAVNEGNFCTECGAKKPEIDGWVCGACGTVNKGKFCTECGAKKPAGVPQYRCDKCGWEPEKGANPPKFCPQCGDPFDDGDIIS